MVADIVLAALGGLLAGSILTTLSYRAVRGDGLTGRPRCSHCKHALGRRELVPVLSYLRSHGRCAHCGEPIARRYLLVEAATAAVFAAVVVARHDERAGVVLGLVLVTFLVALTLIDLDTRLLPNRIMLPAAVAALALGTALDPSGELGRLLAGVLAGGVFLLTALAYPKGMGIGDVKLAAVLGLFLGRDVAAALLAALVAGVAVGVVIMVRKGAADGRRTAIAFGPFLALGAVFALLVGHGLVDAYVASF